MQQPPEVTTKEGLWIARAMSKVSAVDGIDSREQELIDAFLEDLGADGTFKKLAREKFDPVAARRALTPAMREVLVESCWMVAFADGQVSDKEKKLIAGIAADLGVENCDAIRDRVLDRLMQGLSHIRNIDALVAISTKLQS